jgi:hypothetical protein
MLLRAGCSFRWAGKRFSLILELLYKSALSSELRYLIKVPFPALFFVYFLIFFPYYVTCRYRCKIHTSLVLLCDRLTDTDGTVLYICASEFPAAELENLLYVVSCPMVFLGLTKGVVLYASFIGSISNSWDSNEIHNNVCKCWNGYLPISTLVSPLANFLVTTRECEMPSLSQIFRPRSGCEEPENIFMFGILKINPGVTFLSSRSIKKQGKSH